jgi:hypothetical protein
MPSRGIVPRLLPIVHSALSLIPALEVDGQLRRDLPRPGAITRLQPGANAPVELHAPRGAQLLVQDLLVQGMLKPISPPAGRIRPGGQPGVVLEATVEKHYFPGRIYRNNKFLFKKGTTVHLLDAPDGKVVFVMQSYTNHWNKDETLANLKDLGSKLPPGWKYRVKVLDQDLTIRAVNGRARIVQDERQNTYEVCFEEGGQKACSVQP